MSPTCGSGDGGIFAAETWNRSLEDNSRDPSTGVTKRAFSFTSVIRACRMCCSRGTPCLGFVAKHTVTTAQAMTAPAMIQNAGFL